MRGVFYKESLLKMSVCYKKLWKLLIDMDLNKTDLRNATGISSFTIAKMTRGDNVSTSILTRICEALKCDIGDIVGVQPRKSHKGKLVKACK